MDVNKRCTSGTTAFNVALITGWLFDWISLAISCLFMRDKHFLHMPTGKIDIAEALMRQLDFDTKRVRRVENRIDVCKHFSFPSLWNHACHRVVASMRTNTSRTQIHLKSMLLNDIKPIFLNFRDEYPLLMYCRRLNLPAVKMLVCRFVKEYFVYLKLKRG